MNPFHVVKVKVSFQAPAGVGDRQVLVQVNLLVFDRPPEAFHEDVVMHPAPAIHADADALPFENVCKVGAGELNALIGIENIGSGNLQRPFQRPDTKSGVQRDGNIPGQNIAAVPVHDDHKIDKSLLQADIGYVGTPSLIGMINNHLSQHVGAFLMGRMGLAQILLRINRLQSHLAHETANALGIDLMTLTPQPGCHSRNAVKGRLRKLFVNQVHHLLIITVIAFRCIIP